MSCFIRKHSTHFAFYLYQYHHPCFYIIVLDMRTLRYNRGLRDLGMCQASTLTRRWSYQIQPAQRLWMIMIRVGGGNRIELLTFATKTSFTHSAYIIFLKHVPIVFFIG